MNTVTLWVLLVWGYSMSPPPVVVTRIATQESCLALGAAMENGSSVRRTKCYPYEALR
jgi:hypothetical protein